MTLSSEFADIIVHSVAAFSFAKTLSTKDTFTRGRKDLYLGHQWFN